jgi:hypothetical protein
MRGGRGRNFCEAVAQLGTSEDDTCRCGEAVSWLNVRRIRGDTCREIRLKS